MGEGNPSHYSERLQRSIEDLFTNKELTINEDFLNKFTARIHFLYPVEWTLNQNSSKKALQILQSAEKAYTDFNTSMENLISDWQSDSQNKLLFEENWENFLEELTTHSTSTSFLRAALNNPFLHFPSLL